MLCTALWREHLLFLLGLYALQSHLKILWIPSQFGLKLPFLLALANCACTRLSGESCACTYAHLHSSLQRATHAHAQLSAESTAGAHSSLQRATHTCTALCREHCVHMHSSLQRATRAHCIALRTLERAVSGPAVNSSLVAAVNGCL